MGRSFGPRGRSDLLLYVFLYSRSGNCTDSRQFRPADQQKTMSEDQNNLETKKNKENHTLRAVGAGGFPNGTRYTESGF